MDALWRRPPLRLPHRLFDQDFGCLCRHRDCRFPWQMSLGKWAPNSYCHFHKHLGNTTSPVMEGEHHTVETLGRESIHKVRQAGCYAQKPDGDVHMEFAGPQGSVVFFSMQAVDGKLFEV